MQKVINQWKLFKQTTHMGLFGHDMLKPTQIWSNMEYAGKLARKATAAAKAKVRERLCRKNERLIAKGQTPKVYWRKLGDGKFQGGPSLAESAIYPTRFATAVHQIWVASTADGS